MQSAHDIFRIHWNRFDYFMDDDDNFRLKNPIFANTSAIFTMCTMRQSYTERMTKRRVFCYLE